MTLEEKYDKALDAQYRLGNITLHYTVAEIVEWLNYYYYVTLVEIIDPNKQAELTQKWLAERLNGA